MIKRNQIEGTKDSEHKIMLFALSTCIWCRKTRELLETIGVPYEFIYVDELSAQDKSEVMQEVRRHNPKGTFPTLVINDVIIVGYKKEQIERELT
jgi:glutaredoxin